MRVNQGADIDCEGSALLQSSNIMSNSVEFTSPDDYFDKVILFVDNTRTKKANTLIDKDRPTTNIEQVYKE